MVYNHTYNYPKQKKKGYNKIKFQCDKLSECMAQSYILW